MKNLELQKLLAQYPDDMPIKILLKHIGPSHPIVDFDAENILHTSTTAYVNEDAPEDEHDCEDGKVELGDGEQYLLLNPIVI